MKAESYEICINLDFQWYTFPGIFYGTRWLEIIFDFLGSIIFSEILEPSPKTLFSDV